MTKKPQAELRWNVRSSGNPETHEWFLLLVNRPRRLETVFQRFIEETQPIDEIFVRATEVIPDSRLIYSLISCTTFSIGPHNIKWPAIYQGSRTRDRALYERKRDGLVAYVERLIQQKFK
jgi:hypothetical protein